MNTEQCINIYRYYTKRFFNTFSLYAGVNNSMDLLSSLGLGSGAPAAPPPSITSTPGSGQQSLMNDFGLGNFGSATTNGEGINQVLSCISSPFSFGNAHVLK